MIKSINTLLISVLAISQLLGLDGTWLERQNMPEPRSGHAAASVDGIIYISGGRGGGGMHNVSAQVWAYDPQTDHWMTNLPALPAPREDHVMIALGDTLWVFGGRQHEGVNATVNYWVIGETDWQTATPMPEPRYGMGGFVRGGQVYLMGGKISPAMWSSPTDQVDIFDPQTQTWTTAAPLNQARFDFAVASSGDSASCLGGRFVDPVASVEINTSAQAWHAGVLLPSPRSNGAAVYQSNVLVLLGGITANGQAMNNLYFDGADWQEFQLNLVPRFDLAAVVVNSSVYIFGGRNGSQIIRSVEQYTGTVSLAEWPDVRPADNELSVYPNPFNANVIMKISLQPSHPSPQQLLIYDLQGHLVYQRFLNLLNLDQTLQLEGRLLGGAGVYLAKISGYTATGAAWQLTRRLIYLP